MNASRLMRALCHLFLLLASLLSTVSCQFNFNPFGASMPIRRPSSSFGLPTRPTNTWSNYDPFSAFSGLSGVGNSLSSLYGGSNSGSPSSLYGSGSSGGNSNGGWYTPAPVYRTVTRPASPARQCRYNGICRNLDHGTTIDPILNRPTRTTPKPSTLSFVTLGPSTTPYTTPATFSTTPPPVTVATVSTTQLPTTLASATTTTTTTTTVAPVARFGLPEAAAWRRPNLTAWGSGDSTTGFRRSHQSEPPTARANSTLTSMTTSNPLTTETNGVPATNSTTLVSLNTTSSNLTRSTNTATATTTITQKPPATTTANSTTSRV